MGTHRWVGRATAGQGSRPPSGIRWGARGPGFFWVWASLALVVLGFLGAEAHAQELSLGGSKSWADHALLGDPVGASVGLDVRIRDRATIRFGYAHAGRSFGSFGSTCSGLILPSTDCRSEPRAERSRVRALSLEVPIPAYGGEWGGLHVVPGGHMAAMSSRQHGERTGRSRSAEELMAGLSLGVEARVPVAASPSVSLTAGASTRWFVPWRADPVVDGYTPFDTTVRLSSLHAGLAVALR